MRSSRSSILLLLFFETNCLPITSCEQLRQNLARLDYVKKQCKPDPGPDEPDEKV